MTLVQTEVKVSETSAPGTTDGTELRLPRDTLAFPNDDLVKVGVHRVGPVVVGNLHMSAIPATSGDIGGIHVLDDERDNASRRSDDGRMSMGGTSKVHRVAVLFERMRVARGRLWTLDANGADPLPQRKTQTLLTNLSLTFSTPATATRPEEQRQRTE